MAAGADVALVTVIHNSRDELAALLASVDRHLPDAQVVVVDSGSSDDGADLARAWRDGAATVIDARGNVGFGAGNNLGVEAVGRPVTVLINPDAELVDGSLDDLAAAALRQDRLLAPLVLGPDGAREDNAQLEPGSPWLALHALLPPAAMPPGLARRVDPWRGDQPRRIGWAVGSCVGGRTATLERLGPFDPDVFMYAEDLELGLRAADAGVATWFWPAARVRHHGAHATSQAFGGEAFDLLARRRREAVGRLRGARRRRVDDVLQAITFANRAALKRLLGKPAGRERRQLAALRRARRGP